MAPSPEELSDKERGDDSIYDQPGNRPSNAPGGSSPSKKQAPQKSELNGLEQDPGQSGQAASGGHGDAGWRSNVGVGGLARNQRKWLYVHRKKVLGGGIVGTILGLVLLLSIASGPLQFLQFGQLLKQFHFTSQNNTQDDRFVKDVRYIRGKYSGTLEKTRMGYLGNKLANSFEAKLNASGLKSAYSPKHALFDGYTIDRTNEKFSSMTDEQIKAYFKEQGIDVVDGSTIDSRYNLKGELVIRADTSKLSFFRNRSLNSAVLKEANVEGLAGAIGSRLLCKRAGCTLHPLDILKGQVLAKDEVRVAKKQDTQARSEQVGQGEQNSAYATKEDAQAADKKAIADAQKASADTTLTEINDSRTNSVSDPAAVTSARDIVFKGGGLAAGSLVGVACIAKGIADNGAALKQAQVRLPLIRMGVRMIAIADQIKSGQGVDGRILAQEAQQLHGIDGSGKNSSWFDSKSIQANLGNTNSKTGVVPDQTLMGVADSSTPFDFFKSPAISAPLSVVCSTAFSLISFLGAGLSDLVVQPILSFFVYPIIEKQFISWASGQPVDPNVVGGDLGNYADYGAALAANDQAVASGGVALSPSQSAQLNNFNSAQYAKDFSSQSFISKIFSTTDPRSAISRLIDHSSTSPSKNIASMFSGILHVGHSLGSMFNIFSPPALAAQTAGYNYGFATYGFGSDELSDPAYANPEANAIVAEALLAPYVSDPTQSPLVQKAAKCFGVTIAPETVDGQSDPQWGVTATQGQPSDITQIPDDCASDQSPEWKTIRFFILDTETVNSMACYVSDGSVASVEQACTDAGFSSTVSAATGGSGTSGGGSTSSLNINDAAATKVAKESGANVGYALFDSDGNALAEYNDGFENYGASITKSMILVAYLDQVGSGTLSSYATTNLTAMIEQSDNTAANNIYKLLKSPNSQLKKVAAQAGMSGFKMDTSDPVYKLGQSQITAADFAKFFSKINSMIPDNQKAFALNLLSNITPNVGLLQAGLPGTIYSKEGWKPEPDTTNPFGKEGSPWVVNQAAQFSYNGKTYGLAITVASASDETSGELIIKNVAQALVNAN